MDEAGLRTVSVINKRTGSELWKDDDVADFELTINGVKISSRSGREVRVLDGNVEERKNNMTFLGHEVVSGTDDRETLKLEFSNSFCDAVLTASYECAIDQILRNFF